MSEYRWKKYEVGKDIVLALRDAAIVGCKYGKCKYNSLISVKFRSIERAKAFHEDLKNFIKEHKD